MTITVLSIVPVIFSSAALQGHGHIAIMRVVNHCWFKRSVRGADRRLTQARMRGSITNTSLATGTAFVHAGNATN